MQLTKFGSVQKLLVLFILLGPSLLSAQKTAITYELNGRSSNQSIQDSIELSSNPFAKFIGEWSLKNDQWVQNWGGGIDTILIPGHHTVLAQINTSKSLLSIVDGPEPNGHIFWTYNPANQEVGHLSSFGQRRFGSGKGTFYGNNNLRLKVSFSDEAPGTYRVYTYEWINEDEYALKSVQYDEEDQATGLFYQGNFQRIKFDLGLEHQLQKILAVLDDNDISKEEQLSVYADDIVHMAPNNAAITNKDDLLAYLLQQQTYGYADMTHKILEYQDYGQVVVLRGSVTGVFHPSNGGDEIPFSTKNLFVFSKQGDELKISKVIYNSSPNP